MHTFRQPVTVVCSRDDGGALIYPRNPLGKGYVIKNTRKGVEELSLPNLEVPESLLTPDNLILDKVENWQKQPLPQGFGWYGKYWFPRCMYAGVLPEHMSIYEEIQEASLGYVPKDQVENLKKLKLPMMDFKFFNGAPVDMQLDEVKGGEMITLVGMDPEGDFEFALPDHYPTICIDIGDGPIAPPPILQTVCILKEQGTLYMVWRAALPYPGPDRMHELPKLEISVEE